MSIRETIGGRRGVAALAATVPLLVGACAQVGGPTVTFWDVVWSMIFFFFWFMAIWIFITLLADILRRNDISGGWKAIWILVLFWIPFFGALIYIISRPKVTAQDVQLMTQAAAAQTAAAKVSTADELAKLAQLKDAGAITVPEYEALKAKLLG